MRTNNEAGSSSSIAFMVLDAIRMQLYTRIDISDDQRFLRQTNTVGFLMNELIYTSNLIGNGDSQTNSQSYTVGGRFALNKSGSNIDVSYSGFFYDAALSNTISGVINQENLSVNSHSLQRQGQYFENNVLNVDLEHPIDTNGRKMSANVSIGKYLVNEDIQLTTEYETVAQPSEQRHTYSPVNVDIKALKVDMTVPYRDGQLDYGLQTNWVKTENDFQAEMSDVSNQIISVDNEFYMMKISMPCTLATSIASTTKQRSLVV